jgi:GAF domain-containing protein
VLLDDGSGHFAVAAGNAAPDHLSADDSLLVRLRAAQTHLPTSDGAIAIPMLVRRRLRGVLFCRAPERESEFAPDEINALEHLALRSTIAREDLMAEALRQLVGRPASVRA